MSRVGGGGEVDPKGWAVRLGLLILAGSWAMGPARSSGQFGPMQPFGGDRAATKVYFDTSHKADGDLRSADNHARAGNFAEAIEIYQRVIQQFGDKMVDVPADAAGPLEGDSRLSINARRECQRRIAALPAEGRAIYRAKVDPQAERWFRQGAEGRDRSLLARVVEEAFCSSWGDDALDLIGDLEFQDGRFAEALAAYSRLVPDRPGGPLAGGHPDPSVDLAKVAGKKLLCRAAIGERPPEPAEVEAFASGHAADPGPFAGRKGKLGPDLVEALRDDHFAPSSQADSRWPTFAGSPTRSRVAASPIDVGSLQWRAELEQISPRRSGRVQRMNQGMPSGPPPPADRLLAYHPIVVGDRVIVNNDRQVTAYNLNGRLADQPSSLGGPAEVAWRTPDLVGQAMGPGSYPGGLARFTLTARGDRIFARLGQPPITLVNRLGMGIGGTTPSFLVALDRAEGKVLWGPRQASEIPLPKRQAGGGSGSRSAVFEGSPVADDRNVYIAITDRIEMTAAYVACLDAETGVTKWVRYICEANANVDPNSFGQYEMSHRLITLDGPTLFYQTNLGAVASLDAETGSIRWLATYPWLGKGAGTISRERDLNPAVVHDGLVMIAPDDTQSIYAYEAATGRLAWKTAPIADDVKLAHLLGVAKGHLIATGDRVLWFDVKTGKLAHSWPDNGRAAQGFGRGILAGDRVYWPTRTEIHVLDQSTGLVADPPIKLMDTFQCEGGNLVAGDGYLVVAQANALVVFCQNSRLIDRYGDEIARAPDQASNYYRLARAAEATGRDELALASLERGTSRVRPSEAIDGVPLAEAILDHRRQLLMKLGRKAAAAKGWAEAARRFDEAAGVARAPRDRLSAKLELAEVQVARGEPASAVATWQSLLADEGTRALSVDALDGHRSVRADLLIADRLAGLLREKGRDLYAEFDRQAADLLARGRSEKDPRVLEDVARSFPAAKVVPDAWLALGELSDESGRPGASARAYKRLLAAAPDGPSKARALWGLARAYEAQKLWVSARDAYVQARARVGDERVDGRPLAQLVADRLAREPFDRMAGDRPEPSLPVPLRRRWDVPLAGRARPLAADGVPPSAESGRVFLAAGREIRPVDPATGRSPWSRELDGEPVWVGYLADRLIAATRTRLVALSLDKGAVEWQYDIGPGAGAPAGPNPFAPAAGAGNGDAGRDGPGVLLDFRIVGNRVFCLKGERPKTNDDGEPEVEVRALLAFDGDSGLLDWSYAPTAGRINPHLLVGTGRIVLQVRKPNAVLVLDTATGRKRAEFPQGEREEWPRDPLPIDDDRVALVASKTKVALFDTAKGADLWEFEENSITPKYDPPCLFGDAERLLVLHDGHNLIRLDLETGAPTWRRLLGAEDLSKRPEAIVLGADRAFVANGATLSAFSIRDGSPSWKRPLRGPDSGWDVALTERSVVAFPGAEQLKEDGLSVLPMVFHRRDDGEPIQRLQLLFRGSVTDLAVRFSPRGALIATQAGLYALGDRQGMDAPKSPR